MASQGGRAAAEGMSILRRQWYLQVRRVRVNRLPDGQTRRHASTSAVSTFPRARTAFVGTSIAATLTFAYLYVTDTRASIHQWLVPPLIRYFYDDAEDAHKLGNDTLKTLYALGLHPRERGSPAPDCDLSVSVFGHRLENPIGTSAGIDKNAEIPNPLLALGPGIVEVGGVTPYPQEGNPKPRVWRIPSQNALINRYGLNSEGADAVAARLRQRVREYAYSLGLGMGADAERKVLDGEVGVPPGSLAPGRLMAVQVAKMKTTPGEDIKAVTRDYVYCVERLAKYADIMVVNVSSPNTPGLRNLQQSEPLTKILSGVVGAARKADRKTKPAVMVKVSPDENSDEQVQGIVDAVWASGVDGIIVGNTTMKRPDPLPLGYTLSASDIRIMAETGGYSGPQLFERTVSLVAKYKQFLDRGSSNTALKLSPASSQSQPATPTPPSSIVDTHLTLDERVQQTVERDAQHLKTDRNPPQQPLLRVPERHSGTSEPEQPALSPSNHAEQLPAARSQHPPVPQHEEKVIFATGGITNGSQALQVLNAGASVAMVYTALVYGGAGFITRMKAEMRDQILNAGKADGKTTLDKVGK